VQTSRIDRFDIAIIADFSSHADDCWRVGEEVRCAAAAGYSVGLINVADSTRRVNPDIAACLFEGLAVPVGIDGWIEAKLLLIATPERVGSTELRKRPHVRARHCLAILSQWPGSKEEMRRIDARLRFLFSEVQWTAVASPRLAEGLKGLPAGNGESWPVVIRSGGARKASPGAVTGAIGFDCVHFVPAPEGVRPLWLSPPGSAGGFAFDEITLDRFLSKIDHLACFDASGPIPRTAIGKALELGIAVFLPPEWREELENGPIYVRLEEFPACLLRRKARAPSAGSARRRPASGVFCSEAEFRGRLLRLAGPASKRSPRQSKRRDRIFLVSSNGVGIGHLTRLISVARRMKKDVEPVFITFSQGVSILEQFGYAFHYLPSQMHAGIDYAAWNGWLRSELDELLAVHEPAALVYDGNNPYPGMLAAAGHSSRTRLCWIRRGMWRPSHDPNFLNGSRHFDLVVEPDDIAATADRGATSERREEVKAVPPIRLLDESEILGRKEARRELGLHPRHPAVLIQLGSGGNRDVSYLIDIAVEALSRFDKVQIAVVEWLVGTERLKLWPRVRLIRGFPVSRYLNAFDFTISTASYNTFNETISSGLPAIFVPNEHASMDDQSARAAFAEINGAGFHLPEGQMRDIASMLETLLNPTTRALIRLNALRIAKPNGAIDAAEAIQSLAGHG
jgi:glycosyl transferase family 28